MKRREFLKLQAIALGNFLAADSVFPNTRTANGRSDKSRPNILLIMTDQQFAGALSSYGNSDLKTPAMDSIAAEGVLFKKAYVTQPLCQPCRSSIQTGRYPHEIGVITNGRNIEGDFPMLGKLMAEEGYDCGYVGKWHVGVSSRDEKRHGYRYFEGGKDYSFPEKAAGFIEQKRNKPFFLTVSFVNPHNVCQLARDEELPDGPIPPFPEADKCPELPDNFNIPENEPSVIREVQEINKDFHYPTYDWDQTKWRRYLWGYYRLVEKVDAHIGKVLQSLKDNGYDKNTVILFTSDHGEGLAAHHWNQKQILYEEAVRVPFIIAQKGITSKRIDSATLVSTGVDIMPTILDFAGADIPQSLWGRSLRSLVQGQKPSFSRDYIVSETSFARGSNHTGVSGRMLRTDKYKYIIYNKGRCREQLFDMETDPGEMTNLAVNEKYRDVLDTHRKLLVDWAVKTEDDFPYILSSRQRAAFVQAGKYV